MFKRLLVPLDGSPLAETALPLAVELADKFQSEIYLLRVLERPFIPTDVTGPSYAEMVMSVRAEKQKEATDYVEAIYGKLLRVGYEVHAVVTGGAPVHEVILTVADEQRIDAIVMNTHGRSGLGRLFYGSVAEQVLRHSRLPIMLVRGKEEAQPAFEWLIGEKSL